MAKTSKVIKAAQQVEAPKLPASNVVWVHKVIVVMGLPKSKIFAYIERVQEIINAITGNPNFPTPNPVLPKLITDLADLSTKATKAKTKGPGLVDERNAAFKVMDADMDDLKLYLQGIINTIANTDSPEAAVAAAKSAMVKVKIISVRQKNKFTAVQVLGTTSVALTGAKATQYGSHNWTVVSSNPTEIIRIPGTMKATQIVSNLVKGNTYTFYHYPVTKDGELSPEGPLVVTIV